MVRRAADDFAAIRARMEELQRERLQGERDKAPGLSGTPRYPPSRSANNQTVDKPKIGLFRVRRP